MVLNRCVYALLIVVFLGGMEGCSSNEGFQDPKYENCVDQDGDGYGENCMLGPDCDDGDPALNFSCDCGVSPHAGCPCNPGDKIDCFEAETHFLGVGGCSAGTRQCNNGEWSACTGQVLPRDEVCDDIDNDCDGGTDEGLDCDDEPPICDEMNIEPGRVPPNLLLVVDRSTSMSQPAAQGGSGTKLEDTQYALNLLLDDGEGKIRFGWMPYPGSDLRCDPGIVAVECGDDTVTAIRDLVDTLAVSRGTPTGESLQNADAYFENLNDTVHPSFVALLTDGMPTCPTGTASDETLALQAVQNLSQHGTDTFVIGLGEDLNSSNPDLLNDMAVAGGRPRAGPDTYYYEANSVEELQEVLQNIGGMVIGCNLTLNPEPEYPEYLWVYVDGSEVPRDRSHLDGWDYDPDRNQIVFYGSACEDLKDQDVSKVGIKMGCAPPD
jgi:hypothetical protein